MIKIHYDVIVIGSGTGGQTAAIDLKNAGLNVALVEKSDRPGGTCALRGCQAKKWFYEVAEVIAKSRHLKEKGITTAALGDWHGVWEQKQQFVEAVPENTVDHLKEAGVELIRGTATFKDAHTISLDSQTYGADFFVVATGAKPSDMPFEGTKHLATSSEFLDLEHLPERIAFVGGGFISFEFAHFSARIGPENRRALILEAGDRPLAMFDADMVDLLLAASAEDGITIQTGVSISAVEKQDKAFTLHTESGQAYETDLVVHGAGRTPDTDMLDLETIGVQQTKKGIQVNDRMQTAVPEIYAVGDCADSPALARVADFEAHVAAQNIISVRKTGEATHIDYNAVPFVLFTYPQCGMVGQTEAALKSQGISYKKNVGTGLDWPTYRRVGMKHAGFKLLVSEDGRLLGAHVISDHASGLINTFRQAIADGTPMDRLYRQNIMSPYPSRVSDMVYMIKPFI